MTPAPQAGRVSACRRDGDHRRAARHHGRIVWVLRLLLCLLVGAACGLVGAYIGLGLDGSSTQRTSAGEATVSVKVGRPAALTLVSTAPPAELTVAPWTVPLVVVAAASDIDPATALRAVVDSGTRSTLEHESLDALVRAGEHAALAALIGALALGLIGGLATATLTRRRGHVLLVAVIALIAAATPAAIAVAQVATVGTGALAAPNCPVSPQVSLADAARAAAAAQSDPELARSVAIEAACSPAFQAEISRALAQQ